MFNWMWQYFTWKRGARLITTHTWVEPTLLLGAAPDGPIASARSVAQAATPIADG